jgi:prepilin-type N-terminal cleavage/methylation domain-containing protein
MNKGFTLIEILVVVLILAFVSLGIMALLPSGYQQITNAGRLSTMNHLGYEKLDELKALSYTHADLAEGDHPASPTNYRLAAPFDGYSITWTVDQDPPPFTGVKSVTVEVGYMLWNTDGTKVSAKNRFQLRQKFVTYITS